MTFIRSRSLMRGVLLRTEENRRKEEEHQRMAICITHPSCASLTEWADEQRNDVATSTRRRKEPPAVVDDCTDLDTARRKEIAKSHGHSYDEQTGVQIILDALTPAERLHLADERQPLRHYRAEKGDVQNAIRKIKSTIQWRQDFEVDDIKRCFDKDDVPLDDRKKLDRLANIIADENATGKIYCRGYDKEGRAILYLTPGRENSQHEYNNMRHLVYHLERAIACTRRRSGREKVCIVIGYQGFRLSNAPPMSTVKHTLQILSGHYPERMYRAYICDPPLVFRTFWNIIRHFIDPATLEKIAFCTGKEGERLLNRDFDTTKTERQAGGTKALRVFDSTEFLFETPFDSTFDE